MHYLQVKILFKNKFYVSRLIKDKIEQIVNVSGGIVIYNGVDILKINSIKHNYNHEKDISIFSLCGYSKTKGIEFLLESISLIDYQVSFIIGGHYKKEYNISNIPLDLYDKGQFRSVMDYEDIVKCYLHSFIYIQPSKYESFGIPVLEAMYLGTPAIVSKGAGVSELLTNGVDSIVIEYGDIAGLNAAIVKLLEDKEYYQWISLNGRKTAEAQSWSNVSKKYLEAYRLNCEINEIDVK